MFYNRKTVVSGLNSQKELLANLSANCIPTKIMAMGLEDYQTFLVMRIKLMAQKIKEYYFGL